MAFSVATRQESAGEAFKMLQTQMKGQEGALAKAEDDLLAYQEEALSRTLLPETEYDQQPSTSASSYFYHDTEHYILIDRPTISKVSNKQRYRKP